MFVDNLNGTYVSYHDYQLLELNTVSTEYYDKIVAEANAEIVRLRAIIQTAAEQSSPPQKVDAPLEKDAIDRPYSGQCQHGVPIGQSCAKCRRYHFWV